jgi:hypothetical protein
MPEDMQQYYRETLDKLAKQIGAVHIVEPWRAAETAYALHNEVHTGPITSETAFWSAMHELGHVANDDSDEKYDYFKSHPWHIPQGPLGFPLHLLQRQEALATQWALDHAGIKPSPDAAATSLFALRTYNSWDSFTKVGDPRSVNEAPDPTFLAVESRLQSLAVGGHSRISRESIARGESIARAKASRRGYRESRARA